MDLKQKLYKAYDKIKPCFEVNQNKKIEASIVIPVRNGKKLLKKTLEGLFKQDFSKDKYEIIIVDDGSEEDILGLLKSMKIPCSLKYIYWPRPKVESEYPLRRAGGARNLGAKFASGTYLIFLDADMIPVKEFIYKHLEHLSENTVVLGKVDNNESYEKREKYFKNFNDLNKMPNWWILLYSGNFSLSKKIFERVGGFDINFIYWGYEDLELGYRLYKECSAFYSEGALTVHQDHKTEYNSIMQRELLLSKNLEVFYNKHKDMKIIELLKNFFYNFSIIGNSFKIDKQKKKVLFRVGNECNNNCHFCNQIGFNSNHKSIEDIKTEINEMIANNISITLCGGEVAIRKDFFDIANISQSDEKIELLTNGRIFSYRRYCKNPIMNYLVKVFGHNAEIHDAVTKVKGSFNQTIKGIENLKKYQKNVAINLVISNFNIDSVEDILSFYSNKGINKFKITIIPDKIKKESLMSLIENLLNNKKEIIQVTNHFFKCFKEKKKLDNVKVCVDCVFFKECYIKSELFSDKPKTETVKEFFIEGVPGVDSLNFQVTEKCSLNCIMCADKRKEKIKYVIEKHLDRKLFDKAMDSAFKLGISDISFGGGEPFLRKDIFDLIQVVVSKGMDLSIATNGQHLDKDLIQKIVSLDNPPTLVFSLDGSNQKLHDYIRNKKGVFSKLIDTINLINSTKKEKGKQRPFIYITSVVMKPNLRDLPNIINLIEKLGVEAISFQPLNAYWGKFGGGKITAVKDNANFEELWVGQDSLDLLDKSIDKLILMKKEGKRIKDSIWKLQMIKRYFREPCIKDMGLVCKTKKYLSVTSKGMMKPCWNVNWDLGNLNDMNIEEAWFSEKHKHILDIMDKCNIPCFLNCHSYDKKEL